MTYTAVSLNTYARKPLPQLNIYIYKTLFYLRDRNFLNYFKIYLQGRETNKQAPIAGYFSNDINDELGPEPGPKNVIQFYNKGGGIQLL